MSNIYDVLFGLVIMIPVTSFALYFTYVEHKNYIARCNADIEIAKYNFNQTYKQVKRYKFW